MADRACVDGLATVMAQTLLASCVGRVSASANVRLLSFLVLATLIAPMGVAKAATLDQDLRFTPSISSGVTGYLVHVGNAAGFFAGGGGTTVDIGRSFQLIGGVAHYPLAGVIDRSAWLVMQAYDATGRKSGPSNELHVQITPPVDPNACSTDADCGDADACNGLERCVANACVSGPAPTCSAGPCQVGSCDALEGCRSTPVSNGVACDDGSSVTVGDACYAGMCVGVVPAPDPTPLPDPDPDPDPIPDPLPGPGDGTALLFEDFERVRAGGAPAPWRLTDEAGSEVQWSWMFAVIAPGDGGRSLAHPWAVEEPYFVHYDSAGSADWRDYEYAGRIRVDDPDSMIGVTVASRQAEGGGYVALLRDPDSSSFMLDVSLVGTETWCLADADTGYVPELGAWSIFRLRSIAEVDGLRVQAKIWDRRDAEPSNWLVDCFVAGRDVSAGRVGLMASGFGKKYFDDLGVWPIESSGDPGTESETTLPLHREDFEAHEIRQHPIGWLDGSGATPVTGGTPLSTVVDAPGGSRALRMQGLGSDMSAQIDEPGSTQWQDYEVTGRMLATHSRSRFGLLIYGQRLSGGTAIGLLRGQNSDTFRVSVLGGSPSSCTGRSDTLVRPSANRWQQFRLRATHEGASVRVRARVWSEGATEPANWEADCVTAPGAASTSGTFGVWSSGTSTKYWDDIEIREVGVE